MLGVKVGSGGLKKTANESTKKWIVQNVLFGKLSEHNSFAWAFGRNLEVQKSNASLCWCVETCVSIWVSLCNSCNGSHRAWIHLLRVPFSALNKRSDRCAIVQTPSKWTCEREVLVSMYCMHLFYLGSMTIPNYHQTGINKTTETEGVCFNFKLDAGRRFKWHDRSLLRNFVTACQLVDVISDCILVLVTPLTSTQLCEVLSSVTYRYSQMVFRCV